MFLGWPVATENKLVGSFLSVFGINTWVLPYNTELVGGPNEPSWTICTLSLWYWCFPFILPRLQKLTDQEISHGMVKYYWLSVGVAVLVRCALGGYGEDVVISLLLVSKLQLQK